MFIFFKNTQQLYGTVIAYLACNLLHAQIGLEKKLFCNSQPFVMETFQIGTGNGFLEQAGQVIGIHIYLLRQIIQRQVLLVIGFNVLD